MIFWLVLLSNTITSQLNRQQQLDNCKIPKLCSFLFLAQSMSSLPHAKNHEAKPSTTNGGIVQTFFLSSKTAQIMDDCVQVDAKQTDNATRCKQFSKCQVNFINLFFIFPFQMNLPFLFFYFCMQQKKTLFQDSSQKARIFILESQKDPETITKKYLTQTYSSVS